MILFLLSLLAVGIVQSLTIGYPYRTFWTYNPALAQYSVKSDAVHGYLRYLDGSGTEHLVGYNNPEPVYTVRQTKYISGDVPVQKSSTPSKYDETNFRAWSSLQYYNLKRDIDALKTEGKEPSADTLSKLKALEKITFATDFSLIADLPEVRSIMKDHVQATITKEANGNVLYLETIQPSNIGKNQGEIKTYTGNSNLPLVAIEETPEQKQAREEHLRIYNEQIAHLKQLELKHQENLKEASVKSDLQQSQMVDNAIALAELKRTQQEHFRLWNEAKLRAEQADYDSDTKTVYESAEKRKISSLTTNPNIYNLKDDQQIQSGTLAESLRKTIGQESSTSSNSSVNYAEVRPQQLIVHDEYSHLVDQGDLKLKQSRQESSSSSNLKINIPVVDKSYVSQQVIDTPEIEQALKYDETNFRAWSSLQYYNLKRDIDALKTEGKEPSADTLSKLKALEKITFATDFSLISNLPEVRSIVKDHVQATITEEAIQPSNIEKNQGEIKTYTGNSNLTLAAIEETPEQKKAHEKHLRIYNEQIAHLKQLESEHQQNIKEASIKSDIQQPQMVDNAKASTATHQIEIQPQQFVVRDGHSRLVDQVNLKLEQNNQESSNSPNLQTNILRSDQAYVSQQVANTAEVIHARKGHQKFEQNTQRDDEIQKAKISVDSVGQQNLINSPHNVKQQHLANNLAETPEVVKAREEHLRLVQEANLRAQFVEQQESKYKHQSQTPILKTQYPHEQLVYHPKFGQLDTQKSPEVVKTHGEHLRLVNKEKSEENMGMQFQEKQRSVESQVVEETPEVQRAREEHLRIFNAVKSQVEQERAKQYNRKITDTNMFPQLDEYLTEEERFLEMERIREAERLQKDQELLEMEHIREAERLAEEKREREDELIRLRMADEQRLEMDNFLEMKHLQQEQEVLQKFNGNDYEEIVLQESTPYQQPQEIAIVSNEQTVSKSIEQSRMQNTSEVVIQPSQQYVTNPYLKINLVTSAPVNDLQHTINQQQDHSPSSHNPFLKTTAVHVPITIDQQNPIRVHVNDQSNNNIVPSVRYVHSTQQSTGNKNQYIKDDHYVKQKYHNTASSQPADTAEALIALERATNDHFRAHELVLEQLRLARLQGQQLKDCN